MRRVKIAGAALLAVLWANTAAALDLGCIVDNPSSRDWVPDFVLVKIDENTWRAAILDEFTLQANEGGAPAEVKRPTPNRLQINWTLIDVKDRQDRPQNVNFKMTVNLKRLSFNYSGLGESFFQAPGAASGRCAVVVE